MSMHDIDPTNVATPAFVVDLGALEENLRILADVQRLAGCQIILALKGFAMWGVADLVRKYLPGVAASSPHEAELGKAEFKGVVHSYAPAYSDDDFREILPLSDHLVFNSLSQRDRLLPVYEEYREAGGRSVKLGLRLNPEHREVEKAIYDPAAPHSRLGVTLAALEASKTPVMQGLSGLHFHTLCELGADALERTLAVVEQKFAPYLEKAEWVNFGGGHHITRPGYDIELLVQLVTRFKERWGVEVFLEPGEAIAIRTGVLVASVLDVIDNGMPIAILDTSATAHMPDTLEMPYRPDIVGAAEPGELAHTYRLGGLTCLAGDVIGDYSFAKPLEVGDKLVFL
ncbi:MAG: carboxynorspermidine decarboxylase, partial [Polyangiaceae bacterium]|nr:carboxynorspermidine decarboxylase [Polyangiaceae bacterium]